jgi:Dolichyl-phosphate-mannose-protein mannosyltransferase
MKALVPDQSRHVPWRFALAAICLIALGLRILGLTYGLPAIYNPDETPILNRALAFAKGDPRPQNYVYPSLYFYLQFIWQGLFFAAAWLTGIYTSLAEFQRDFFIDPSRHFLAGRVFSVLCGTVTVLAVYVFGRRLYDRATGVVAAAALAVSPIAARDAHYVKLDVPTTMFVVFAHAALARIVVDPAAAARRRSWFIAGLLSGLAVSTQYYAVFLGFTIAAVALADLKRSGHLRESGRLFLWATFGSIAGFFLGTPFLLFDLRKAISDIAEVREVDIDRALVGGTFASAGAYLRILLWDAMGWPISIAAGVGAIWALVTDWRRGILLVSFFIPFFAFIANTVPMSRYLNVVLPLVALAGAFALVRAARSIRVPACGVMLVIAALVPGFMLSLETDLFIRQTDTRTVARDFITSTVPSGRSFLVQPYGPPLRQSRDGLIEALRANLGNEANASTKFQLMLALDPYPEPSYRLLYLGDGGLDADKVYMLPGAFAGGPGLTPLRRAGINYVILKQTNVPNPELRDLEAALARNARRLAVFTPYRADTSAAERARIPPFLHNTAAVIHPALERPGPTIEIWQVDDD